MCKLANAQKPAQITKNLSLIIAICILSNLQIALWARMDSNHRTPKRTDLQSVAVGHLATCPDIEISFRFFYSTKQSSAVRSHLSESNQRPTDYKSVALPAELKWRFFPLFVKANRLETF